MKEVSPDEVTWTHSPRAENDPHIIRLTDDIWIERGMIIESEGNRGIVFGIFPADELPYFSTSIYWFEGPLAKKEEDRRCSYDNNSFLAFFGLRWKEGPGV